jgi:chromosome segregation ATPase
MSDQHDRHLVVRECKRLVKQYEHLTQFLNSLEALTALETEGAELRKRVDALKREEAEARARVDAATKEASDAIAAGKAKASQLVADAERHAAGIRSQAEATEHKLSQDTAALSAAQAQLSQVQAHLDNLRARLN